MRKIAAWRPARLGLLLVMGTFILALLACDSNPAPVLKVGGIPDQDSSRLARRYDVFSSYLSRELDVEVEYVPSADYAAVVTAFGQNQLQLAFFGALTGVQARLQNPGALAIVQRENDAKFNSKLIARPELGLNSLEDLKANASDLTITFGSESSTSGHLMPRYFITEAGINPDEDFRTSPSFTGSHDKTWQLVLGGSYDIGALSEDVWNRAVRDGKVSPDTVVEFYTTPEYVNYNWTVQGNLDEVYGDGFTDKIKTALLNLGPAEHGEIMELFSTEKFIETNNANYQPIESVARDLGMIR
ncbi:MAG: putative selenate ABC transporter substrate-binding protein [Chloroflexi bacterium]|nr:putative selenate ABC transporter substrate-binding protein [Chloroflexota bacterium]